MPTTTKQSMRTVAQRTAEAVRLASEHLGLDDAKRLGAALAESAAEWVRRDPAFVARVHALYAETAPRPKASGNGARRQTRAAPDVELRPLKQIDGVLNPAAPPDPYFLLDLYGPDQLPLALQRYTAVRLREAAKQVQGRHPGTKPSGTSRQQMVDYIMAYVAR